MSSAAPPTSKRTSAQLYEPLGPTVTGFPGAQRLNIFLPKGMRSAGVRETRPSEPGGGPMIDNFIRGLRHALRALCAHRHRRATFAIGIRANSAVFSALDAVLLKPLPLPDADRLV